MARTKASWNLMSSKPEMSVLMSAMVYSEEGKREGEKGKGGG